MLVFVDVGAHIGYTLAEVTKPRYTFDKIFAFEPMPKQFAVLVEMYGSIPHVELLHCGLLDMSGKRNIYGSNTRLEASIYDNIGIVDKNFVTQCDFLEASEFFKARLSAQDTNIIKINCEGSEILILNNLMDTGEIWKITNVMIDFDIRKIESMRYQEQLILDRFRAIGFDRYSLCDDAMIGDTHQVRIAHWLSTTGIYIKPELKQTAGVTI